MNATKVLLADHDPEFYYCSDDDDMGGRGVTIELSDRVADELRRKLNRSRPGVVKGLDVFLPGRDIPVVPDDQDWDCIMPNMGRVEDEDPNEDAGSDNDPQNCSSDPDKSDSKPTNHDRAGAAQQFSTKQQSDDKDDDLSYTPPPTLPVVWVDAERLTGYVPTTESEWATLRQSVRAALLWGAAGAGPAEGAQPDGSSGSDPSALSTTALLDFDERVTELFATGVARHADNTSTTSTSSRGRRYVSLEYPEYLVVVDPHKNSNVMVQSTARIWKRLQQQHPVPVVERLWQHLRQCSRSLLWKHALHQEWLALVQCQEKVRMQRQLAQQLQQWQLQRRPKQLEQLYAVRETLFERVQQARQEQAVLEQQRDCTVQRELLRRRSGTTTGGVGSSSGLDWESTVFAFPEEDPGLSVLGFHRDDDDDNDHEDEEYRQFLERQKYHDQEQEMSRPLASSDDDDDDDDDSAAEQNLEDTHPSNPPSTDALTPAAAVSTSPKTDGNEDTTVEDETDNAVARVKARPKATPESKQQAAWQSAQAEEEAVRESCTTHQVRMAVAVTQALQTKLQQVDNLLESLQEEQWAEEEEQLEQGSVSTPTEKEIQQEEHSGVSVLDQVLAMILGATPPPEGTSLEEHVKFLEREHLSILDEWKQYFGCLPPSLPSQTEGAAANGGDWDDVATDNNIKTLPDASTPQDLRQTLGIVENENGNWDSDDEQQAEIAPQPQRPPIVGLRPGGRLQQRR